MKNDRFLTIEDLEKFEALEMLVEKAERLFYEKLVRFKNGDISRSELIQFSEEETNIRNQYQLIKAELVKDYNFTHLPFHMNLN